MKITTKSDTSKTTVYRTRKLQVGDFECTESYTDGVLTGQSWSVKGGFKQTHPTAYEPKNMYFHYYEDISFLDSDQNSNLLTFYDIIPKPTKILDWDAFDHLDHILCIHLSMDGNVYRINSPDPIPLWRHQSYIGGFCNDQYDLNKVVKIFEKEDWIRNIQIVDIPYYNCHDNHTQAVEFEYKLGSKKELGSKLKKYKLFKDKYFGV